MSPYSVLIQRYICICLKLKYLDVTIKKVTACPLDEVLAGNPPLRRLASSFCGRDARGRTGILYNVLNMTPVSMGPVFIKILRLDPQ